MVGTRKSATGPAVELGQDPFSPQAPVAARPLESDRDAACAAHGQLPQRSAHDVRAAVGELGARRGTQASS